MADLKAIEGALNPVGGIVSAVGGVLDDLFTSDEERLRAKLDSRAYDIKEQEIDASLLRGQQETNKEEAKHASRFVAGWRPAVGWVCVVGLAYQFIIHPMLTWLWVFLQAIEVVPKGLPSPPPLDLNTLLSLLFGILGLGGYRTFETIRGKARSKI